LIEVRDDSRRRKPENRKENSWKAARNFFNNIEEVHRDDSRLLAFEIEKRTSGEEKLGP
jgi:hypothetical protein